VPFWRMTRGGVITRMGTLSPGPSGNPGVSPGVGESRESLGPVPREPRRMLTGISETGNCFAFGGEETCMRFHRKGHNRPRESRGISSPAAADPTTEPTGAGETGGEGRHLPGGRGWAARRRARTGGWAPAPRREAKDTRIGRQGVGRRVRCSLRKAKFTEVCSEEKRGPRRLRL